MSVTETALRIMLTTLLILICVGPAIFLCWSMRGDRERIRYMTGRFPFDEDNRPATDPPRIQPWERPYRGNHWPDPRPANAQIDDDDCAKYIDRAERSAMNRRISGALVVLVTASVFGNQLTAIWSNAPEMNWLALGGFCITFVLAMMGVFRQEFEARHWTKVAEAYRARRQRMSAEARAHEEALRAAQRTFPERLSSAWKAFRG
ncbi:hypothetical protein [Glycomyces rhizosphaerae]|uniref:DUF4231 domain-containing protein n=1 Tax=Glycomyces rhizosphaerae TaxID=2054422 RepID=A0ABV7Q4U3_9ACTN